MATWRKAKFGYLYPGTVFRVNEDDAGLYLKLSNETSGEWQDYNTVVIVSSRPGESGWCQAGEFTEFEHNDWVQYLVGREEMP